MTEDLHSVSTTEVARYLAQLNGQGERDVEKILVRQVHPQLYACQVWFTEEREPEGFFLSLAEE